MKFGFHLAKVMFCPARSKSTPEISQTVRAECASAILRRRRARELIKRQNSNAAREREREHDFGPHDERESGREPQKCRERTLVKTEI